MRPASPSRGLRRCIDQGLAFLAKLSNSEDPLSRILHQPPAVRPLPLVYCGRCAATSSDPEIADNRGRAIKTTGDGFLAEFASVVDAVRCAAAWQAAMPAERVISNRTGIHQGNIVLEAGDIFGDGVNVTARLEAHAEPGGICVSARVYEDAAGRL